MEINAKLVMSLRDKTTLPMMQCKEALLATKGNHVAEEQWFEQAIEYLRKKGVNTADRFAGRETTSGGIGMSIVDGWRGSLVLLGCQTDFVAKSEMFKELAKSISFMYADLETDGSNCLIEGKTVDDLLVEKTHQMGEKLTLVSSQSLEPNRLVTGSKVVGYNHDGRVAAIVTGTGDEAKLKNVVLHIVSSNPAPVAVNRKMVDPSLVDKEAAIIAALPEVQNKPEAIRGKIILGKLDRFYKERVLLEQEMLLDAEKKETVGQYLARNGLTIDQFIRVEIAGT
jgi:elongation factor Ts